eukprot:scaffold62733_cov44-Phaeocystis_antarctica.AAC.1
MNGMAPIVMPTGGGAPVTAPIVLQATPKSTTVAPTEVTVIAPAEIAEPAASPAEPIAAVAEPATVVELDAAPAPSAVFAGAGAVFAAALDAEADADALAAGPSAHAEVADASCPEREGSPSSGQPARDRLLALRTLLNEGL